MNFDGCSKVRTDRTISVKERGRSFAIDNPERESVLCIVVDGCLIEGEEKRCDHLFEIGDLPRCALFVELKGADVGEAAEQLISTMNSLHMRHKQLLRVCYIVASRVPRAGPKVQGLKLEMRRRHSAFLYVSTTYAKVRIDRPPYNSDA
jgi:hypothetical protein